MFGTILAIALAGQATGGQPAPLHFDCRGPVTQTMSAGVILTRFGDKARRGDIAVTGGAPVKGVILYPDDPTRRLEIVFWDDAQTVVESVSAGARAVNWTGPLGLHPGSSLEEALAANGRKLWIDGFDWDYGGYVTNSWGGRLQKANADCAVQIRFVLPAGAKAPGTMTGEHLMDTSQPQVKALHPYVGLVSIGWPLPAGVKASAR